MWDMQPMDEAQARRFLKALANKLEDARLPHFRFLITRNDPPALTELANLIRDHSLASAFTCPVCGFVMRDEPDNYNICPSCGTEFRLSDQNATIEELRASWLATGPKWWAACAAEAEPEGWNPLEQLKAVTG